MKAFFKKYYLVIIAAVVVIGVLVFAFLSGGNVDKAKQERQSAQSSQSVQQTTALTEQTEPTAATAATVADTTAQATEKPSEKPTAAATTSPAQPSTQPATQPASKPEQTTTVPKATEGAKDKYKTDPVPSGKPEPVEPQEQEIKDVSLSCTLSVSCATILDNMDKLDEEQWELVPPDGWLLKPEKVEFKEGESVFDVLKRVCMDKKLHLDFTFTPIYNSVYIEGIGNLYEFDCGANSGWIYKVNDWVPNYGCSRYSVKDGDTIEFLYTCDLGYDVGAGGYSYTE